MMNFVSRRVICIGAETVFFQSLLLPMPADPTPSIPAQPIPFRHAMPYLTARLRAAGAIRMVAIGSSSTAGEGDIVPYPQRLESALRAWRNRPFDVLNRGVGGEEAPEEVARLQRDALDEKPSVIIWQVGSNAVWKKQNLGVVADAIAQGLALLAHANADVILMDPQYAPALLTPDRRDAAIRMTALIDQVAGQAGYPVNVFHRFDLMRQWVEAEMVSFDRIIDPTDSDRLHQSDWCARRLAETLGSMMLAAAEGAA